MKYKRMTKKNLINKNGQETNRAPSEIGQGARFVDLLMTCFANYYDIIKKPHANGHAFCFPTRTAIAEGCRTPSEMG